MDEGGQLAAEYSSKQSKETQMAHKADRKLSNLAVHAEHGLLRAGLGRRAFEGQVGQPSQNRYTEPPPPQKKKKRKHTKQPTQTRPGRRTEKDSRGGGRKATASTKERRKTKKKKGRGTGKAKGRPGPQKQGHPERREKKKGWDEERGEVSLAH